MLERIIDVIFGAQTVAHLRDLLARKAASSLADKMYTLRHLQKPLDDAHLTELVHRTVAQLQSESSGKHPQKPVGSSGQQYAEPAAPSASAAPSAPPSGTDGQKK